VFVIPGERVKNGEERLVVLNRVAKSVIERMRGLHPVHVFVHARTKDGDPRPVTKINNTAWKAARERAAMSGSSGTANQHRKGSGAFGCMI
jgi:integrase